MLVDLCIIESKWLSTMFPSGLDVRLTQQSIVSIILITKKKKIMMFFNYIFLCKNNKNNFISNVVKHFFNSININLLLICNKISKINYFKFNM